MNQKETSWLIKKQDGKIFGPYSYEKLFTFIEKGMISGEEWIAEYPSGEWFPISKDMDLNSKLLDELEKQVHDKSKKEIEKDFQKYSEKPEKDEASISQSKKPSQPMIQADEDWEDDSTSHTGSFSYTSKTIEVNQKKPDKKRIGRFLIVIGLMALFFLYYAENYETSKPDLIIAPDFNKSSGEINRKDLSKKIRVALNHYKEGEKRNYIRARDILIPVIERDATNTDSIALLCLIYKELWPYSNQSSKERRVMNTLVEASTRVETFSASASTCTSVFSFLEGSWLNAQGYVDRVLKEDSSAVAYYFLKAEILNALGKEQDSTPYYRQAYRYWPDWILPRIKEGEVLSGLGKVNQARQIWQKALDIKSSNESAAILLAHTYMFRFQKIKQAKYYIDNFKREGSEARPEWQAKGFETLAAIAEKEGDSKSVEYAKKALEHSANASYAKEILDRLGEGSVVSKKSTADAYIASGDFMASQNRHFEAQAEYKAAFELNPEKSVAALKAAKSLWEIDQEKEAILWLNKALEADPKNLEANLQLALYYGERYNFLAAANQMKRAQKIGGRDHRIFQTFAKLEFLRRNYKAAINHAQNALKKYDADLESIYILAKAELKRGNYREAHYASSKAVELESNNPKSQALYAETLAYFQGFDAGVNYIRNLINTYPSTLEYRQALAKIYFLDDKYENTIRILKQIENHDVDKVKLYSLLAKAYQEKGDYTSALDALLSAAQARPSDVATYVKIGDLQLQSKKYKKALDNYKVAKNINENYPKLNSKIGKAYLNLGRYGEALDHAEKEIQRNPKLVDGYLLAGEVYSANGQYSKAAGQFQKVIQINPNSSDLYIKIARAHRLAGNLDLARSMLSIAGEKESGNPEIYKESGALLEAMGSPNEAIMSYKKYLKLSPNAADRNVIKQIISRLGG